MTVEQETKFHSRQLVSTIRTEYINLFKEYYRKYRIKNEKTLTKTPQQNELAVRMNRSICERVRSMLSYAKLSKIFWSEAVRTAADIINLSGVCIGDGCFRAHVDGKGYHL